MRASSQSFQKQVGAPRIVNSYDGYNSYLLITDAKTRFTWVFLTATKSPPVDIVHKFLTTFGLRDGYRALRVDQGGELWRSDCLTHCYFHSWLVILWNPLAVTVRIKMGKLNASMAHLVSWSARSLLYSAGLPPAYWSAALVHAVYLKNRL